ncbi:MAG: S9 family peptidase, partial [Gemmatimonadota bacterium]
MATKWNGLMKRSAGILAFASLAVAAPAVAQQSQSDSLLTVNHYLDLEQVANPQISPDGKTIVYSRGWIDKQNDKWESAIWVMNADGTKNRFLVKGGSPIWSPDGTRIAYVAPGEAPKGAQIFVRYMDAEGGTSQVTRLTEGPGSLQWSPDGKWLSFTKVVPKTDPTTLTVDMPAAPPNAKWTPGPRVVERLHYRMDRSGYSEVGFTHLFVVPADGGSPRQLTSGDWSVGNAFDGLTFGAQYDWLPNGKTIVIEGLNEPDADLTYRDGNIYAVDVATAAIKRLTPERGSWSHPVISPDGSKIAYTGYPFVKQTYRVADLYVMNADGTG